MLPSRWVLIPNPYMEMLSMSPMTLSHHWCIGIDLHKDTMTVCTYCRCCGEIAFRKIACKNREQVAEFFRALPRPHTVAIEAVGFYRWLWELLEPIVQKLVLADATQARALAGRRLKTDREDAQNIAELLADGRLPLAYTPPLEVQILRDWTRQRNRLSHVHARILHGVKSLLNTNNRPGPARLTAARLIGYLTAYGDRLPERHVRMLWQHQRQLSLLEEEIGICQREIARLLDQPRYSAVTALLLTAPEWDRSWPPRSWPRSATSVAFPTAKPSAAMPAWPRDCLPRAEKNVTGTSAKPGQAICAGCCSKRPGPPFAATQRSNAAG